MLVNTSRELIDTVKKIRASESTIGLVPTMGYLHDGHSSLIKLAKLQADFVLVTDFVNPLQFGPNEDFDSYPKDLERDLKIAHSAGADLLFAPSIDELYGKDEVKTSVRVKGLSSLLEGAERPGHFDGVATVVTKLFSLVGEAKAYFGEKDYQQLQIVRTLVKDLSLPIEIVGVKTVREPDGLAMSSRNVRLTKEEREEAKTLYQVLLLGKELIKQGLSDVETIEQEMIKLFASNTIAVLDYVCIVDSKTLEPLKKVTNEARILIAARFPSARLIDNIGVSIP